MNETNKTEKKLGRWFCPSQFGQCKKCGIIKRDRKSKLCRDCYVKLKMQRNVDVEFWNKILNKK